MRKTSMVMMCLALWGCIAEDPTLNKEQFSSSMAKAVCSWVFKCCDSAERKSYAGTATDEAGCAVQLTSTYLSLYQTADPAAWMSDAAVAAVQDMQQKALKCDRGFDPSANLASYTLVLAKRIPGDPCATTWECTSKFCRTGTCANPLTAGATCTATEPCVAPLRCISSTCKALQPDGSSCIKGEECMSGACGAGQCVNSLTYTCDGK